MLLMSPLKTREKFIKESNLKNFNVRALPNSSNFSYSMREMIGSIMRSKNSLKISQDESRRANILGDPIQITGVDKMKIIENICELTPEIYKAQSDTGYTGKSMKNENDILMMNNIIRDLEDTGREDRDSKRKKIFTITLPKLVEEVQTKNLEENTDDSDDLQGEGVKIIIPSNITDIYTRFEILLGLKLSGHTDTLTEASNLIDELYKRGEIQNKQQYRNALDKFKM